MVETQQPSDTTYRLYDYGRGRELHLEDGMKALQERTGSGKVIRPAPSQIDGTQNRLTPLVSSSFFEVVKFDLKQEQTLAMTAEARSSARILVALEGCGQVEAKGSPPVTLAKGDALVVPAAIREFHIRPQWELEFLKATVPGTIIAEPPTKM